jgi:hypothetical protein
VPLPKPEAGLVIRYEYLWRNEVAAGADTGTKQRPCAIVVAVTNAAGITSVVVAPITHIEPMPPARGIEIPPRVKRHLGLDAERSWMVASDLNTFIWPGVDLYPIPGSPPGTFDYGLLPPLLHKHLVDMIKEERTKPTLRSD